MIGKKVAHYEVIEKIGAGGMGEVFRARDTKLGRDVALKMLPHVFEQDPERLARFQREAKLLASLNHPNIATIHGIEESEGHLFLVMELVGGEDLSVLLRRGAMPVRDALAAARSVADALAAAHEQGVVHRDLKPANVKLAADGTVKVLDFGLAKALEGDPGDPNISHSPTVTALGGTAAGVILGTAAYMSPEQARGKAVDKRTDVWAFGCVLFEALTGQQAFPGETVSDTIAKILEREPDWSALPANTPASIARLMRRCLEKDQKRRLGDIGDARVEIEDAIASGASASTVSSAGVEAVRPARGGRIPTLWAVITLLSVLAAGYFAVTAHRQRSQSLPVVRATIPAPEGSRLVSNGDFAGPAIISPDGKRIAFIATNADLDRQIFVRELDATEARALPGTEGASFPFWSPDAQSVGYFSEQGLMRVEVSGGAPIRICAAPSGRGGTWNRDGVILFAPEFRSPINRVPATGGTPEPVTAVDTTLHSTHRWPVFMPDGEHFTYIAAHHDAGRRAANAAYFASINGGESKRLLAMDTAPVYASGQLLYLRDNTCLAIAFDPTSGKLTGEPRPMLDKVQYDLTTWRAAFSASQNGIFVYHAGQLTGAEDTRLVVYDRSGEERGVIDKTWIYYGLSLSPDGSQVAVSVNDQQGASNALTIWTYDVERKTRARVSFRDGTNVEPVWSPDGKQIAYGSVIPAADTPSTLRVVRANGGDDRALLESDENLWPTDWSADGRYIVYVKGTFVGDVQALWVLSMTKPMKETLIATNATHGRISPDGRWLAYTSDDSGREEVFVVPFQPLGDQSKLRRAKWQVSTVGATRPAWREDGKELYFLKADGRMFAAEVDGSGESFRVGDTRVLFTSNPWNFGNVGYAASGDGQQFLVNCFSRTSEAPITILLNWQGALRK